jgi:hypothetical protein
MYFFLFLKIVFLTQSCLPYKVHAFYERERNTVPFWAYVLHASLSLNQRVTWHTPANLRRPTCAYYTYDMPRS